MRQPRRAIEYKTRRSDDAGTAVARLAGPQSFKCRDGHGGIVDAGERDSWRDRGQTYGPTGTTLVVANRPRPRGRVLVEEHTHSRGVSCDGFGVCPPSDSQPKAAVGRRRPARRRRRAGADASMDGLAISLLGNLALSAARPGVLCRSVVE